MSSSLEKKPGPRPTFKIEDRRFPVAAAEEPTVESIAQVLQTFQNFDISNDGFVDRAELAALLTAIDADVWTDEKFGALLAAADSNEDTRIDYFEFLKWVVGSEDDEALHLAANKSLEELHSKNIVDMLGIAAAGRRYGLVKSRPDDSSTAFAKKASTEEGNILKLEELLWAGIQAGKKELGVKFACRKGLRPETTNQADVVVAHVEGAFSIYAVFSGHGKKGHEVSNFVQEVLLKVILDDKRFGNADKDALLKDAFLKTQKLLAAADAKNRISAQSSGVACILAIHDHARGKLTIANVGLSQAVLSGASDASYNFSLTPPHSPDRREERSRIENNGGRIVFDGYANYRVYAESAHYPGLNMSRTLGDLAGHRDAGLIAEPTVIVHYFADTDDMVLLGSSGIWEFLQNSEAVEIVQKSLQKTQDPCLALAKAAWDQWMVEEGGAVAADLASICICLPAVSTFALTLRVIEADGTQTLNCTNLGGETIYSQPVEPNVLVEELRAKLASDLDMTPIGVQMVLGSGRILGPTDMTKVMSDVLEL